ncbi:MAG: ABC transporter transmembrane domain-containing protein [Caldilineaceae bacterium]
MSCALAGRLQGNFRNLLFVILASLGLIFPRLLVPIFTQLFIDNYLGNELRSQLVVLLIGMGVTAVLLAALTWLQAHYLLRLRMKLAVTMSAEFLWHVLRLPMNFFTQRYRGEIGSRIGLNDTVAALLSQELVLALLNLVLALFYLLLMLYYSIPLTLVAVGFGAINIVVLRLISRLISDSSKRMLQEQGKLLGVSMNGISDDRDA